MGRLVRARRAHGAAQELSDEVPEDREVPVPGGARDGAVELHVRLEAVAPGRLLAADGGERGADGAEVLSGAALRRERGRLGLDAAAQLDDLEDGGDGAVVRIRVE